MTYGDEDEYRRDRQRSTSTAAFTFRSTFVKHGTGSVRGMQQRVSHADDPHGKPGSAPARPQAPAGVVPMSQIAIGTRTLDGPAGNILTNATKRKNQPLSTSRPVQQPPAGARGGGRPQSSGPRAHPLDLEFASPAVALFKSGASGPNARGRSQPSRQEPLLPLGHPRRAVLSPLPSRALHCITNTFIAKRGTAAE
ncbi:hypothetical protein T492DRAFT_844715 [Pavlovales sp. CCMP2436]|nr:hypothetical protein T492DRAFT_844715 [Pavlovales sp. CCMP2436]